MGSVMVLAKLMAVVALLYRLLELVLDVLLLEDEE
jgi:hypothetical protein